MKDFWKIGLVTIVVGVVLMMLAMMFGGGVRVFTDTEKFREQKNYTFEGNYSNINIQEGNVKVNIKPSVDDKVYLTTFESEDYYYEISELNGLNIHLEDRTPNINFFFGFGDYQNDYYLELSIPAGMIADIDIQSENGGININGVEAQSINIENDNGKIEVRNTSTIGDIYLDNDNGMIIFEEVKANDVTVRNGNGAVDIEYVDANSVDIENNNGKVEMKEVYTNNDTSIESDNGILDLLNIYTDGSLYLGTDNGNIKLSDIYFAKGMEIETSNGKIEGNIIGKEEDFSFDIETDNGNVEVNGNNYKTNYHNQGGSKLVKINANNASINIKTQNVSVK